MKNRIILLFAILLFSHSLFAASKQTLREDFIKCAKAYLGVPYVYGGTTRNGMDCSGFVQTAARDAGISLPRTTSQMFSESKIIDESERQAGDLVFFTSSSKVSHVGIYIGSNKMIHCASEGSKTGVIISKLSETYWKNHYYKTTRILSASSSSSSASSKSSKKKTSTSANKKKINSMLQKNFDVNVTAYLDWTVFQPDSLGIMMKGASLQAEVQLSALNINPGVMVRYTYPVQEGTNIDSDPFSCFNLPVCLTLHLNDYFTVYAGAVLSTGYVCNDTQKLLGTTKEIQPLLFPGIFGACVNTPEIEFGSLKLSLVQDLSFTIYQNAEGSEPLTFTEAFAAGLCFSTGLSIKLPF